MSILQEVNGFGKLLNKNKFYKYKRHKMMKIYLMIFNLLPCSLRLLIITLKFSFLMYFL